MPRLVAAPDKFKGTVDAGRVAAAACQVARRAGWDALPVPMADGGEGTLDVLGGANRVVTVEGPLGEPVRAEWRLDGREAVVEMARASGLSLVGGADGNRPLEATTRGTGQMILAAVAAGARRVVVGVGGSATTDGGWGAVEVLAGHLNGIEVVVACDVDTRFEAAARQFAGQKGASDAEVVLLERRLARLVQLYRERFRYDVADLRGGGAAGGLAGGLAALGARLVPGFDLLADVVALDEKVASADLVVTGEGFLDEQSFNGKVVGGVAELCQEAGVPLLVVAGDIYDDVAEVEGIEIVSLTERFGSERSHADPLACIEAVVGERLARSGPV